MVTFIVQSAIARREHKGEKLRGKRKMRMMKGGMVNEREERFI
jgi:hypothetical protein